MLILALTTGMRRGKPLGLKWQSINLDEKDGHLQAHRFMERGAGHGVVTSEPKTESSKRRIALSSVAVGVLKERRLLPLEMRLKAGANWHEQDLVFCNVYGNFLHPFRLYQLFHKVLAAGLPHMRFHDVRRLGDCKIALKEQKVRASTF